MKPLTIADSPTIILGLQDEILPLGRISLRSSSPWSAFGSPGYDLSGGGSSFGRCPAVGGVLGGSFWKRRTARIVGGGTTGTAPTLDGKTMEGGRWSPAFPVRAACSTTRM